MKQCWLAVLIGIFCVSVSAQTDLKPPTRGSMPLLQERSDRSQIVFFRPVEAAQRPVYVFVRGRLVGPLLGGSYLRLEDCGAEPVEVVFEYRDDGKSKIALTQTQVMWDKGLNRAYAQVAVNVTKNEISVQLSEQAPSQEQRGQLREQIHMKRRIAYANDSLCSSGVTEKSSTLK